MHSIIGVGNYLKEDYTEIYDLSEDKESMDDTWEEWRENRNKTVENLRERGLKTIDILVKPRELVNYCRANGLPINGSSRSDFVAFKAAQGSDV